MVLRLPPAVCMPNLSWADVLQDPYHALMRIAKELRRYHTDYGLRRRQLCDIFAMFTPKSGTGMRLRQLTAACSYSLSCCAAFAVEDARALRRTDVEIDRAAEALRDLLRKWVQDCKTNSDACFRSHSQKLAAACALVATGSATGAVDFEVSARAHATVAICILRVLRVILVILVLPMFGVSGGGL